MNAGPLLFVANVRLPSERANAYQILVQADALAAAGVDVEILAPRRRNRFALADHDVAAHYGLRAAPRIRRLATFDMIDSLPPRFQRLPFVVQSLTFARSLGRELARREPSVVWSRDAWSLAWIARGKPRHDLFYEAHDLPSKPRARARLAHALDRCRGVAAITHGLREDLERLGVPREKTVVLADAFDPRRFAAAPDRDAARVKLGLDPERKLAVYTGHLFPWKGASVLVAAAASADFDVLIVGGRDDDRARLAAEARVLGSDRVTFVPPVPPLEVPDYLAAADVLVLPNSARERISERYTSPLKLFEYLAAGRPIVASNLPSLREILADGIHARLVPADDAAALRRGIREVLGDPSLATRLAAAAAAESRRHTFDARAARLIEFVAARRRAR
jgi:glycosyltransferase involved in cell wall biosynthesis